MAPDPGRARWAPRPPPERPSRPPRRRRARGRGRAGRRRPCRASSDRRRATRTSPIPPPDRATPSRRARRRRARSPSACARGAASQARFFSGWPIQMWKLASIHEPECRARGARRSLAAVGEHLRRRARADVGRGLERGVEAVEERPAVLRVSLPAVLAVEDHATRPAAARRRASRRCAAGGRGSPTPPPRHPSAGRRSRSGRTARGRGRTARRRRPPSRSDHGR